MSQIISGINSTSFYSNPITSFFERSASKVIPHHALNAQLKIIADKVSENCAYQLSFSEMAQVKEAFKKCNGLISQKIVKNLTDIPFNTLKEVIFDTLDASDASIGHAMLSNFFNLIENEEILAIFTGLNADQHESALEKDRLIRDKALHSVLELKSKAVWKEILTEASYFVHHILELFISMTGVTEIGGSQSPFYRSQQMGSFEAKTKFEFYLTILAYPSILFGSIFALIGSVAIAGIATAIIVASSVIAMAIYLRYFRPCPKEYFGLENLNTEAMRCEKPQTFQRKQILDRIQNAFECGKGVILVADPGTGKTTLVESLAELIVAKKCKDFLKTSQIFSGNANQFNGKHMDSISLISLAHYFKRHEDEVIFFFDEIHSAFKEDILTGRPADSLLTFQNKFRRVIYATTTQQYNEKIEKDKSFNRRNIRIDLQPLTAGEIEDALVGILAFTAPELCLEDHVIQYIIKQAQTFNTQTSEIDAATSLLAAAIAKATRLSFDGLEDEIAELMTAAEHLENQFYHSSKIPEKNEIARLQEIKELIGKRKIELVQKLKELKKIKNLEKIALNIKKNSYELASKAKDNRLHNKRKWMINRATQTVLNAFIVEKRLKLGMPAGISKELIDSIRCEV